MNERSESRGRQPLVRILLAVNLLFFLVILGVLDYASSVRQSTLLWVSGGALLALLAPLCWLAKRARVGGEPSCRPARPVSLKHARWALLLILLLAAGLRLYRLGKESFWYDEVWTADWAGKPLAELAQVVNPLPYLISRAVLRAGDSEFMLRSTSAVAGVLGVAAVYLLGHTLFGRREGLVAAALLALSAYSIYHSQELRYYSWLMVFPTFSLYFLLRGLRHNRLRDWAGFAACTILNAYNHPFALFVLASEGLYAISVTTWEEVLSPAVRTYAWGIRLRALGHRLIGPVMSAVTALVLYTPQWRSLFSFYNPEWVADLSTAPASSLLEPVIRWTKHPFAYWIYGLFGEYLSVESAPFLLFWLLGLFMLGLVVSRRRTVGLALLWILVPMPVLLVVGIWLYPRYMCYFLPLLLVVMAHGLTFLSEAFTQSRKTQTTLLVALTALGAAPSLLQLPAYYAELQKDQWRELAALVDARHREGDLLLVNSAYLLDPLPFDWYSTTPPGELVRRPFPEGYVLTQASELDQLGPLTQGYDRVWLVFCRAKPELQARVEEAMPERLDLVDEVQFVGLRLLLFEAALPAGSE